MKKMLGAVLVAVLVLGTGAVALAQWGGPGYGPMMGPGGGPGWGGGQGYGPGPGMGRGGRGGGYGPCAQGWQQGGQGAAQPAAIDEAKAKEIAGEYVKKNLAGYQVEKIVKFERPRGTMYRVEAKGPNGEIQYLSINPFGNVRAPRFSPGRVL